MLTPQEIDLVYVRSKLWTGPNTWGWVDGYRLDLKTALELPGFG